MGLLLLIVVGGVLGWLASILMRADDRQNVAFNVAIGIAGALGAGLAANNGPIFSGLSAIALLVSLVGAAALLFLANLLSPQRAR